MDLRQVDRSLGFCTYALHSPDVLVVSDTTLDRRFAHHLEVVGIAPTQAPSRLSRRELLLR